MLICCSMSVLRPVREAVLAVRSTRLAFRYATWATTATPPLLSAPTSAPPRSTPTGKTSLGPVFRAAKVGWDPEASLAMLTITADCAETSARTQ